jgi:hypothetical protein
LHDSASLCFGHFVFGHILSITLPYNVCTAFGIVKFRSLGGAPGELRVRTGSSLYLLFISLSLSLIKKIKKYIYRRPSPGPSSQPKAFWTSAPQVLNPRRSPKPNPARGGPAQKIKPGGGGGVSGEVLDFLGAWGYLEI